MDPRKERSRAAIRAAFLGLLAEKDYAKITVDSVIARASVGRATFYAQFTCKDDLIVDFVGCVCEELRELGQGGSRLNQGPCSDDPLAHTTRVLERVLEHGPVVRALVSGSGSRAFTDALRHAVVARAALMVPEHPTGPAAQMNRSFLLHHIAASFVGMIQWWAWRGFSAAPGELAADYLRAIMPLFSPAGDPQEGPASE